MGIIVNTAKHSSSIDIKQSSYADFTTNFKNFGLNEKKLIQ